MVQQSWRSWVWSAPLVVACAGSPGAEEGEASTDAATGAAPTTTGDAPTTSGEASGSSSGAGETEGPSPVAEFGRTFTVIGTADDGLNAVRDLEFNPMAPEQLWTFNMLSHGTVIYFDPGTPQQTSEERIDAYGQHFMAYVSSAAFGDQNNFATCNESRNEWNVGPQAADDFMGPALWPADLEVFAKVGQEFPPGQMEGSHLDMLHQSPLCMGIAHEVDNVFWAFDGKSEHVVRYDFQADHGPGGSHHGDGIIRRYLGTDVTRVANIPGHMEVDHASGLLYVADTGGGRVMRLDTATGTNMGALPGDKDGGTYEKVEGADWQVFAEGLGQPSGLALHAGRVFVTDHKTAEIVAFDLDGAEIDRLKTPAKRLMGVTVGPDGKLWYADAGGNQIVRVDP